MKNLTPAVLLISGLSLFSCATKEAKVTTEEAK
jgi:hypothetical protein